MANPMLETIARRQEVIARLGIEAAWDWFLAQAETPGTPSWSHQEPAASGRLLAEKDKAAWRRMEGKG